MNNVSYDARPPTISVDYLGFGRSRRPLINISPRDEREIVEGDDTAGKK